MSDHRSRDDMSELGHPLGDLDGNAVSESTWDEPYSTPAEVDDPSDAEGIVHDWEIYPESIGAGAS